MLNKPKSKAGDDCRSQTMPPGDCRNLGADLAGHPDLQGLCQALTDWSAELRIIEQEICADK
jgi:hypothetical protein